MHTWQLSIHWMLHACSVLPTGKMSETLMVKKEPISAMSNARNGTKRAVTRHEMARPVRTMNRRTPPFRPAAMMR